MEPFDRLSRIHHETQESWNMLNQSRHILTEFQSPSFPHPFDQVAPKKLFQVGGNNHLEMSILDDDYTIRIIKVRTHPYPREKVSVTTKKKRK